MPTYVDPYVVEFVGGPYCGHAQEVNIPPECLVEFAELPMSRSMFAVIRKDDVIPPLDTVTSVAVYEFRDGAYHFTRFAATDLDWEPWIRKVVVAWRKVRGMQA